VRPTIDMMLDGVQWVPLPPDPDRNHGLPWATHRGVLKIDTLDIECIQLSDGRRVISEAGLQDFLKWLGA
jgi:hypothetical protein